MPTLAGGLFEEPRQRLVIKAQDTVWTPPAAQASLRLEQVPRGYKAPPPVCCTQAAVTGVMGFAVSWSVSPQWTALLVLPALGNVDSWFYLLPVTLGQDVSYGPMD